MTSLSFLIQLLLSHDWHKINFSKLMWTGESHNHCQNNQPSLWNNDLKWLLNISQIIYTQREKRIDSNCYSTLNIICFVIKLLWTPDIFPTGAWMQLPLLCHFTTSVQLQSVITNFLILLDWWYWEKNRQLFSLHLNWYCCW